MNYQNETFGMMDQGYFVPRTEIISWINGLLKLNITKIEQLGAGSIYCQILDVIYPGKVSLNKVNWKAKNDYEFMGNFRILQNSFDKLGIKRHVQVEKLSKAKYQDNLQFIQWMKRYYDLNCGERGANYPAEERRGGIEPDFSFAEKTIVKHVYNAGNVQTENAIAAKAKKIAEMEKKVEKVQPIPTSAEKPIREKAATVALKPQTNNSQTNFKNLGAVISPKRQSRQQQKQQPKPQPQQVRDFQNTAKIQELEEMLASERRAAEQSRQQMEELMANELHNIQMKYQQQEHELSKRVEAYKQKIDMIADVMKGDEPAEEKIKLIEQIVNIGV